MVTAGGGKSGDSAARAVGGQVVPAATEYRIRVSRRSPPGAPRVGVRRLADQVSISPGRNTWSAGKPTVSGAVCFPSPASESARTLTVAAPYPRTLVAGSPYYGRAPPSTDEVASQQRAALAACLVNPRYWHGGSRLRPPGQSGAGALPAGPVPSWSSTRKRVGARPSRPANEPASRSPGKMTQGIISDIRSDSRTAPPPSAAGLVAGHRDREGNLLPRNIAAIELLDVAGGSGPFAQDVRRYCPFFPAIAGTRFEGSHLKPP